jgi:hypothetical protein
MSEIGFFFLDVSRRLGRKKNAGTKRNGTHQHNRKGRDRSRERERERARERANSDEEYSVVYMTTSAALKRHFWDPYFRGERNKEWVGGGGFVFLSDHF